MKKNSKSKIIHHLIYVSHIGHAGFYMPIISEIISMIIGIKEIANRTQDLTHYLTLYIDNHEVILNKVDVTKLGRINISNEVYSFHDIFKGQHYFTLQTSDKIESLDSLVNNRQIRATEDELVIMSIISELYFNWSTSDVYLYGALGEKNLSIISKLINEDSWQCCFLGFGNNIENSKIGQFCESNGFRNWFSLENYIALFYMYNQKPIPFEKEMDWRMELINQLGYRCG